MVNDSVFQGQGKGTNQKVVFKIKKETSTGSHFFFKNMSANFPIPNR